MFCSRIIDYKSLVLACNSTPGRDIFKARVSGDPTAEYKIIDHRRLFRASRISYCISDVVIVCFLSYLQQLQHVHQGESISLASSFSIHVDRLASDRPCYFSFQH